MIALAILRVRKHLRYALMRGGVITMAKKKKVAKKKKKVAKKKKR
jgi:hypothetical protein